MQLVANAAWHRSKIIERIECIVIGAGVIGLACARALALRGLEVVILESQESFGMETSSRNSEVIHAGIYYPLGTNKAKWCVAGKQQLYKYCQDKNIAHKRIGKLIIATNEEEITALTQINERAKANGVHDLELLSQQQVHALEPQVQAVAGLFSPSTGIIDSHNLMLAFLGDAQAAGAMLAVNSKVICGKIVDDGVELEVLAEGEVIHLHADMVINAAGLYASQVAKSIAGMPEVPQTYYRKGNYFTYNAPNPFSHLVYPVPVPGGLGTHSTMDLAGQVRFGPDVEWIEQIDYTVTASKRDNFATAICRYWPAVNSELLQPGYAGIRPTLADQQGGFRDFVLHKFANIVSLFGIESPGLTASLAISDAVASPSST